MTTVGTRKYEFHNWCMRAGFNLFDLLTFHFFPLSFFLSHNTIAIYVAPEILMNDRYDESADVYSFAICLIAMIRADENVVKFFFNGLRKEMKKKTLNGIGIHVLNNRLHNRGKFNSRTRVEPEAMEDEAV